MNKDLMGKFDIKLIIKSALLQIAVTVIFIAIFSAIMYFFETDYKYSPVFGSVSVAAGAFASAFYISSKKKSKGYLNGLLVGAVTFFIVTIVGLIINDGGVTINTLFHLIIIMLSALTGGILGVNRKGNKYI